MQKKFGDKLSRRDSASSKKNHRKVYWICSKPKCRHSWQAQEQETIINEAEKNYNKKVPEAIGKATRDITKAEGYALKVVNKAKGDVAKFKAMAAEYKKSPKITRDRMKLETMEEIYSKAKVTFIDEKLGRGVVPYLEIKKPKLNKSSQK